MANPFALAHFAIAHWKDIFSENFFIQKSTPASVGSQFSSNITPLPKQKLETHSYSTLLEKAFAFDFFLIKALLFKLSYHL